MDLTSGETDSQSTMNGETTDESPANHPKEIIDEKCENDCEEVSGNFIDPAQVTEKDSEEDERDIDNNSAVSKDDVEENVIGSLVENTVKEEEEKDAVEEQEEAEMTEKSRDKDSETTLKDDTTEIKPEIEEKHKDEWLDILGNGLLKKKVSLGLMWLAQYLLSCIVPQLAWHQLHVSKSKSTIILLQDLG